MMKNKYIDFLNNIKLNEEKRNNILANLDEELQKRKSKKVFPLKKKLIAVACSVLILFLGTIGSIISIHALDGGEQPTDAVFPLNSTCTYNGGNITFNEVKLIEHSDLKTHYLVLIGDLDCEAFFMYSDGFVWSCSNPNTIQDLNFSSELSIANSEADLHIDEEYASAKGTAKLFFRIPDNVYSLYLENQRNPYPENWSVSLHIVGYYLQNARVTFTFSFSQMFFE